MESIREAKKMLCNGDFLIPPYLGLILEKLLMPFSAVLVDNASF